MSFCVRSSSGFLGLGSREKLAMYWHLWRTLHVRERGALGLQVHEQVSAC